MSCKSYYYMKTQNRENRCDMYFWAPANNYSIIITCSNNCCEKIKGTKNKGRQSGENTFNE